MCEIDRYLDRLIAEAGLGVAESERVRGELRDHLETLVRKNQAAGRSLEEAVENALDEFGDPSWLGRALHQARGGWRAWTGRWLRPVPVALILLFMGWTVNTYAFEVYSIVGSGAAPRLPQGSHVVVEKWGPLHADDIVIYRDGGRSLVGIVESTPQNGRLPVRRNDQGLVWVEESRVVGHVVLKVP